MQGFDNYACNIIVLAHTTPPASRDFGAWRQALLTELERIVRKHGAQLNHLRQVHAAGCLNTSEAPGLEQSEMCMRNSHWGCVASAPISYSIAHWLPLCQYISAHHTYTLNW